MRDDPVVTIPFVSDATRDLDAVAWAFTRLQKTRIAFENRGDPGMAADLLLLEKREGRKLGRLLRGHELWPWLSELDGLGGPTTARLLAVIKNPWRFPGQPCSMGHVALPVFPVGAPCPASPPETADARSEIDATAGGCGGVMLEPRQGTGVRSLWRYGGLDVDETGHAPRRRKGVQSYWNTKMRTLCVQPRNKNDLSLSAQIVRHRTPRYRDIYDRKHDEKLAAGLKPADANNIAKKVAVKAFVGDLLVEWKRVTVPPAPLVGVAEEAEDWLRALT